MEEKLEEEILKTLNYIDKLLDKLLESIKNKESENDKKITFSTI